jgi:hypothetical protein
MRRQRGSNKTQAENKKQKNSVKSFAYDFTLQK